MSALGAKLAMHLPVAFGLVVGSLAKFGRMLAVNQTIKARHVIGHILMMGAVGLAATVAVNIAGITSPRDIAFTSSIFAVAASDVVQYLATRAWKRFFQDHDERLGELRNEVQVELSAIAVVDAAKGERE